jgi:hypothetical protein
LPFVPGYAQVRETALIFQRGGMIHSSHALD